MDNEITFYPTAKWVSLNGAFTIDELKKIIKKLEAKNGNKK